jgi:hypothetical protein
MGSDDVVENSGGTCQFPERYPEDFVSQVALAYLRYVDPNSTLTGARTKISPNQWVVVGQSKGKQVDVTVQWNNGVATALGTGEFSICFEYLYSCADPERLELKRSREWETQRK